MGKGIAIALMSLLLAMGSTSADSLPADYSLEQAKADGCVVYEDSDVTQGSEQFEEFARKSANGEACSVRLAFYYPPKDPSRYSPEHYEYYESIKDEYPKLYIHDLSFDGERYTIRSYEDSGVWIKSYQYLMKYEGPAESRNAEYSSYVHYVLTNDDKVTWYQILQGGYSTSYEDEIDFDIVYNDLIYDT